MQVFAILCLICILIASQHLLNWYLRAVWKERHEANLFMTVLGLVVIGFITFFAGKYLILWSIPLIVN